MAHQFMDDIGFGSVMGHAVVADILGGAKHASSKGRKEVAGTDEAGYRFEAKAGSLFEKRADIAKLWDLFGVVTHLADDLDESRARVRWVKPHELFENRAPGFAFHVGIGNRGSGGTEIGRAHV